MGVVSGRGMVSRRWVESMAVVRVYRLYLYYPLSI